MAVLAETNAKSEDLLIWDIGGRSTQFVSKGAQGFCHVDGRNEGSGLFKDYIIEKSKACLFTNAIVPILYLRKM